VDGGGTGVQVTAPRNCAEGAFETSRVTDGEQLFGVRPATGSAHLLGHAKVDFRLAVGAEAVTVLAPARDVRVRCVQDPGRRFPPGSRVNLTRRLQDRAYGYSRPQTEWISPQ
jgi:hypothetical protein